VNPVTPLPTPAALGIAMILASVLAFSPFLAMFLQAVLAARARREQRARDLIALAMVATARDGCGCISWDPAGDRFFIRPCDEHTDQLLRDVTAR
jgi:hypothetical protein